MVYFFYSKNDKDKEPIMSTDKVNSKEEAIVHFANLKKMLSSVFLSLFSIGERKK